MTWFQVLAQGHHGYPQPEDGYESLVYRDFCLRCGVHGRQIAPFRLKPARRAEHSAFLQLNWVFDAFFVPPDVVAELTRAGISGASFDPALNHRTGLELSDRIQLLIPTIVSCAETSRLPSVTCRPNNEESRFESLGGRKRFTPATPYCGSVKYHPPASLAVSAGALKAVPDLFQTGEWFGSGGSAHRLTICSERFAALAEQRGWRGLEFRGVKESGWSGRALRTQ